MSFEYHPKCWETRLEVMRDVFPWVNERKKELAGLSPDDDLSSVESATAFIRLDDEYRLGTRSTIKEICELHLRQNEEWTKLTGLGPLSVPSDWRTAGHFANAPDAAIQRCDVELLARFIIPWARSKQATFKNHEVETICKKLTPQQRRLLDVMVQHRSRATFEELREAWNKEVQEDAIVKALKRLREVLPRSEWSFEISEANWEIIWHKKGQTV